jgi:3-oxoacyl-[acyl-carrier-protein] synthase-3
MEPVGNISVRITGTGSFLPGSPISIDEVDYFLGDLTEAPEKIRAWLQRMKSMMKEMLEVEN